MSVDVRAKSGFSLLEMTIALSVFSVIGYALTVALDVGATSQSSVITTTQDNKALRSVSTDLSTEMRVCNSGSMSIDVVDGGNNALTLQQPIVVAGVFGWGVSDQRLGPTEAQANRFDWSVRYTVVQAVDGAGAVTHNLHRQILDESDTVQLDEIAVEGIRDGSVAPFGFSIIPSGDLWQVEINRTNDDQNGHGQGVEFNVQTLN